MTHVLQWSWEPFLTPNPTEAIHHHPNVWLKCNRWHLMVALGHESEAGLWLTARDYFKEQAHGAHTLKISPSNCGLLALKAVCIQKLMSYSASIFCTSCRNAVSLLDTRGSLSVRHIHLERSCCLIFFHRIKEMFRLEKTLKTTESNHNPDNWPPQNHVTKWHSHISFKSPQGWGSNLSWTACSSA